MGKTEQKAREIAKTWHEGQYRDYNGKPYFTHPEDVVGLLKRWGVKDEENIAVAYMHDLLEDTNISKRDIQRVFGNRVLNDIESLTKNGEAKQKWLDELADKAKQYVIIIKIADRIANTHDFIKSNKIKYAEKYFHKADRVFRRLRADNSAIAKNAKKSLRELEEFFQERRENKIANNLSLSLINGC